MALALLANAWAETEGGTVLALTVDHRLRPEAAAEAATVRTRLGAHGIASLGLTLAEPPRGPGLAEQARIARYGALAGACAGEGIVHLLLGHHRGDQAETAMLRVLSASGARGLAGMAALTEIGSLRLLRPLLDVAPAGLRAFLVARGVAWVEDPSNRNPASARVRLRLARADADATAERARADADATLEIASVVADGMTEGTHAATDGIGEGTHAAADGMGEGTRALASAMRTAGAARADRDRAVAAILADRAAIYPEGHAHLTPGPIDPEALAALLRTVGGAPYAPPLDRVALVARDPGPTTIGGVRILTSGRLGPGWLLVRETRAMAPPVPARPGAVWDGRFRLGGVPDGASFGIPAFAHPDCHTATIGALGRDAARLRRDTPLPSAVLHGLPAVREGDRIVAIPHIGIGDSGWRVLFAPPIPAAGAPFVVG